MKALLVISTILILFIRPASAQYTGGDNDGSSSALVCAIDLNGASVFSIGAVTGSSTFCNFATEVYSISISGSNPETTITWSVPVGASIVSGQGTNTILVSFGNTAGDVSVSVANSCSILSALLTVNNATCGFYAGGSNDGFSGLQNCATNLNGGSVFIPGPIVGSSTFCDFATEAYSITVAGAISNTVYVWTVPAGATITSGQGTNSILVTFGNTAGNVSVDVSNECQTINVSKPVSTTSCIFYSGGINDGYSHVQQCATNLNGGSVFSPGAIVGSSTFCDFATETYSITVAGAISNTVYVWSVPAGATITSGQGTNTILVTFGNTAGNVSVDISNECETINVSTAVSSTSCIFYAGGSNDGYSHTQQCASSLNGGSVFIPGPIIGSTTFCEFATETYTITVAGAISNTVYNWSVPAGATITSGQGTNTILVTFGNTAGNVSVDVSNECETVNVFKAVSLTSCIFYAGGSNDGFSTTRNCVSSLNGGSGFIPGPIVGSATFCEFATEAYTITVAGANSTTTYTWSVPIGASIVSGQGTSTILVSFGNTSGNVSVDVANECQTINVSHAVALTSCIFYAGGSNDGFSVTTTINIPLPVELVSFSATVEAGSVKLLWVTASELNNDYFQVERSQDGIEFFPVVRIPGAGTTSQRNTYQAMDENPLPGTSYYRLSQVDFDGTISYSRVAMVHIAGEVADILKLYPNPVRQGDILNFEYFSDLEEVIKIAFIDPAGRRSDRNGIPVKTGWNKVSFEPEYTGKGVYIILIRTSRGEVALRLIVF